MRQILADSESLAWNRKPCYCNTVCLRVIRKAYAAEDEGWDLSSKLCLGQSGAEVLLGEVADNAMHSTRCPLLTV